MVEEKQHQLKDRETTEAWLTANSIDFHTITHVPVMTMAEMNEAVLFEGDYAATMIAKNLFFQDKKNKERMWVVCACHDTTIDLKALTKTLGCGSGNLRAGSEEAMYDKLGARKGALTLFSILNDTGKSVEMILDKRLAEDYARVAFHPMTNEATTSIAKEGMMKVIAESQREARVLDFAALAPAVSAAPA
mmetsp:Transcript_13341/g.18215  ORF Transcript_13341/g.18215 Transcript_13341/m.18215 type:complete len:191 (+) Transcript_13341:66-638(+)